MSIQFETALKYVLQDEGKFVSDPSDSGGVTNCGITIGVLSTWLGRPASTIELLNLPKASIAMIYESFYWKPIGCDSIDQYPVALVLFDAAVLFGVGTSAIFAQKALADSRFPTLAIDGHIGPNSVKALNEIMPDRFIRSFHGLLKVHILGLTSRFPKNIKFQRGWENRVDRYLTIV